jgi:hypothetical protein
MYFVTEHHAMKAHRGSGVIAPPILDLTLRTGQVLFALKDGLAKYHFSLCVAILCCNKNLYKAETAECAACLLCLNSLG